MMKKWMSPALLACAAVAAAPVLAHPGHTESVLAVTGGTMGGTWEALASGFVHPLTGLDHLLALAAAGVWSARQPQGVKLLPVFLGTMLLGALAGIAGFAVPGLETGIAATVVALGLLMAAVTVNVPAPLAMALCAGFAALHGNAHGLELPAAGAAGYIASSALLLAAGRGVGAWASARMLRIAGAGVAVAGLLMLS